MKEYIIKVTFRNGTTASTTHKTQIEISKYRETVLNNITVNAFIMLNNIIVAVDSIERISITEKGKVSV